MVEHIEQSQERRTNTQVGEKYENIFLKNYPLRKLFHEIFELRRGEKMTIIFISRVKIKLTWNTHIFEESIINHCTEPFIQTWRYSDVLATT